MAVVNIAASQKTEAVTPSDTAFLTYDGKVKAARGIYIGGAGDIAIENDVPATVLFENLPAGTLLPIATQRVLATSTTATSIVALY